MRTWCSAMLVLVGLPACRSGGHPSPPPGVTLEKLTVTSKSFVRDGAIPVDNTCDGADHSPQLTWSAPPAGAKAIVIVVDDPDAIGGDFTHWLAFNLAAGNASLQEGVDAAALGGEEGTNSFGRIGYAGPCPPRREMHRYAFRVYAVDAPLAARAGATRDQIEEAMSQHVLAEGTLVGTFAH
jgi:Raf kinase inhibitor-like YbhB/YbcL family protein